MTGLPRSLLLVGAGKMGGALLQGWLDQGLAPAGVAVVEPHPSDALRAKAGRHGFALREQLGGSGDVEVVVLAVKPQMLEAVAPALDGPARGGALLVSIMAGKTIADLSSRLAFGAMVRAMPNTPAAVRQGVTGLFANRGVTPAQRAQADALFTCVGTAEWLDREDLMDAVTAVSGSGPAYAFLLVECLAEAGRALGLPADQASRMARATVIGAASLLQAEPARGADQLRRDVTSPGGTTAAALDVLMGDRGFPDLLRQAVHAARDRAVALSG